jgi:Nuclease-related domain
VELLNNLPPTTWALVAAAIVVGWLLAWAWSAYRQHRARKALIVAVTAVGSDHLADVLVPDGMGGSFHLDFVLLTPQGIVVIDLRDIGGNIFGGDQMTEWTVMDGQQRFTFTNPQSALFDRVAAVKAVAGEVPVEGRIVFTRRGKFPKGLPKCTLMVDSLKMEFPTIERAGLSNRYQEEWRRLKEAVSPSAMNQVRPLSVR